MLNVGRLNKRITFLRQESGIGEAGETTQKWVRWRSVWATVRPIRAYERMDAQKLHDEEEYRIICRYGAIGDHVISDMRIQAKIRGKIRQLEIIGNPIDKDNAGEYLEISVKEYPITRREDDDHG